LGQKGEIVEGRKVCTLVVVTRLPNAKRDKEIQIGVGRGMAQERLAVLQLRTKLRNRVPRNPACSSARGGARDQKKGKKCDTGKRTTTRKREGRHHDSKRQG